jgi:tripartite-type tricarboxylate transporter receptor subunit TctC
VLSGDVAVGRPILIAPEVPVDRVKALRKAFDDTLKDPRFIAAAEQTNMYINPMSGEELQQIVRKVAGLSPKVIAMVKEAIKTKDLQELPADQKPKGDSSGGKE